MAIKFITILILFIIPSISLALMCQRCLYVDCEHPKKEQCLEPGESMKVACLHQIFKDLRKNETTISEVKKCVLFEKDKAEFECVRHPNFQTVSCNVCDTDFCNSNNTAIAKNQTENVL